MVVQRWEPGGYDSVPKPELRVSASPAEGRHDAAKRLARMLVIRAWVGGRATAWGPGRMRHCVLRLAPAAQVRLRTNGLNSILHRPLVIRAWGRWSCDGMGSRTHAPLRPSTRTCCAGAAQDERIELNPASPARHPGVGSVVVRRHGVPDACATASFDSHLLRRCGSGRTD